MKKLKVPPFISNWILDAARYSQGVLNLQFYEELEQDYKDLTEKLKAYSGKYQWETNPDTILPLAQYGEIRRLSLAIKNLYETGFSKLEPRNAQESILWQRINRRLKLEGKKSLYQVSTLLRGLVLEEVRENKLPPHIHMTYIESKLEPLESGFPQGNPTSPTASILAINSLYEKWKGTLTMYMDDGLLISNNPIDVKQFNKDLLKLGYFMDPEKSSWIKKDGKWLKDLKFLGIKYLHEKRTLRGDTRNGSTLETPINDMNWKDIKFMGSAERLTAENRIKFIKECDLFDFSMA